MMYNTFIMTNTNFEKFSQPVAEFLQALSSPARIAILVTIGYGESCVCHLESILGLRQAYISQHLMALRKANLLKDRRDGRFIYYSLVNPAILTLIRLAADECGIDPDEIDSVTNPDPGPNCECPNCAIPIIPTIEVVER